MALKKPVKQRSVKPPLVKPVASGNSVPTATRPSALLDFDLLNAHGEAMMTYGPGSPPTQPMVLRIRNPSGDKRLVLAPKSEAGSLLALGPYILALVSPVTLLDRAKSTGFEIGTHFNKVFRGPIGGDYWNVGNGPNKIVLEPGAELSFSMPTMAVAGGAQSQRVNLALDFHYEIDGRVERGRRTRALTIAYGLSSSGTQDRQTATLHAALAQPFIVNDGVTANDMVLEIINKGHEPVTLGGRSPAPEIRFQLPTSVNAKPGGDPGALLTPEQRKRVTPGGDAWNVISIRRSQQLSTSPWVMQLKNVVTLAPHHSVNFKINGIVSEAPSGTATMTVSFFHFPTPIADQQLTIIKQPLRFMRPAIPADPLKAATAVRSLVAMEALSLGAPRTAAAMADRMELRIREKVAGLGGTKTSMLAFHSQKEGRTVLGITEQGVLKAEHVEQTGWTSWGGGTTIIDAGGTLSMSPSQAGNPMIVLSQSAKKASSVWSIGLDQKSLTLVPGDNPMRSIRGLPAKISRDYSKNFSFSPTGEFWGPRLATRLLRAKAVDAASIRATSLLMDNKTGTAPVPLVLAVSIRPSHFASPTAQTDFIVPPNPFVRCFMGSGLTFVLHWPHPMSTQVVIMGQIGGYGYDSDRLYNFQFHWSADRKSTTVQMLRQKRGGEGKAEPVRGDADLLIVIPQ